MITTINSTDQSIVATELNFDEFQEIVKVINGLLVPAPKSDNNTANEDYYNIPAISLNQLVELMRLKGLGDALEENNISCKIKAIKKLREITGCYLKEANDIIEGRKLER